MDTYFEKTLFVSTPLIGEYPKQIKNSHVVSLNHLVGDLMNITVQTCYDIQYLTICISGYMNSPTESYFLALRHGMEYLIHRPHEPIMYSRNNFFFKTNEIPHHCFFKAGDT